MRWTITTMVDDVFEEKAKYLQIQMIAAKDKLERESQEWDSHHRIVSTLSRELIHLERHGGNLTHIDAIKAKMVTHLETMQTIRSTSSVNDILYLKIHDHSQ